MAVEYVPPLWGASNVYTCLRTTQLTIGVYISLWSPHRRRRQWKNRVRLRTSTLGLLLVVLGDRIYDPRKEPDRYRRHGSECDCVAEEDHTRCGDRQLIQGSDHAEPR